MQALWYLSLLIKFSLLEGGEGRLHVGRGRTGLRRLFVICMLWFMFGYFVYVLCSL